MVEKAKSEGQVLVEKIEGWLLSFMAMPKDYALVCALWVVNSWVFKVFDSTPYLCITAATKQSGKTTLLELVALLSKVGKLYTDPSASVLFRTLEMYDGWCSLFFDEAEKMSGDAARTMKNFCNSGYRKGGTMPRTMPGGRPVEFPVYCPKAFSLIGDVYDTLRDRSIVLFMSRGKAERKYRRSEAEREAAAIVPGIESVIRGLRAGVPLVDVHWLSGRDEEIWMPLISLGAALGLDRPTMDRLTRASADLTAGKTQIAKRFVDFDVRAAEAEAVAVSYGERALRDLLSVCKDGESALWSAVAVERMREIPTGPWRTFKGEGLNEMGLADLVSPFGLGPRSIKRNKLVKRGYQVAAIRQALKGGGL